MKKLSKSSMTTLERIENHLLAEPGSILTLTDEDIDSLLPEDIEHLQNVYGGVDLMRLPPREKAFFDWLKAEDPEVWHDLWEEDEDMLVTLAFLGDFKRNMNGFPICDLEKADNYFFTKHHVKPEGIAALSGILTKAERGEELSIVEALMFEIVSQPVDIWHFCYKFGIPVEKGKHAARQLAEHNWLVHLPEHDDSIRYVRD